MSVKQKVAKILAENVYNSGNAEEELASIYQHVYKMSDIQTELEERGIELDSKTIDGIKEEAKNEELKDFIKECKHLKMHLLRHDKRWIFEVEGDNQFYLRHVTGDKYRLFDFKEENELDIIPESKLDLLTQIFNYFIDNNIVYEESYQEELGA